MSMIDLILLAGCAVGFVLLERLVALKRGQKVLRSGWLTDVLHIFVGGAVIRLGMIAIAVVLSVLAVRLVPGPVADAVRAQPVWAQYLMVLITAELGIYWTHRMAHAVPVLWRFHAVHHSSRELDWMSSHREHPVEQLMFSGVALAPAIVFGIEPLPLLIYGVTYHVHALLLHANVRLDFGPLAQVIGSPRFHHWHHADQREAYDMNFGAQLSILDRIFGTFRLPETGHPERYGVSDPVPDGFLGQLAYPLSRPVPQPSAHPGESRDERKLVF
jgi:sterol desaturase/sphingolipid hydroxylase (fatty acid hydroxylase superfamily)